MLHACLVLTSMLQQTSNTTSTDSDSTPVTQEWWFIVLIVAVLGLLVWLWKRKLRKRRSRQRPVFLKSLPIAYGGSRIKQLDIWWFNKGSVKYKKRELKAVIIAHTDRYDSALYVVYRESEQVIDLLMAPLASIEYNDNSLTGTVVITDNNNTECKIHIAGELKRSRLGHDIKLAMNNATYTLNYGLDYRHEKLKLLTDTKTNRQMYVSPLNEAFEPIYLKLTDEQTRLRSIIVASALQDELEGIEVGDGDALKKWEPKHDQAHLKSLHQWATGSTFMTNMQHLYKLKGVTLQQTSASHSPTTAMKIWGLVRVTFLNDTQNYIGYITSRQSGPRMPAVLLTKIGQLLKTSHPTGDFTQISLQVKDGNYTVEYELKSEKPDVGEQIVNLMMGKRVYAVQGIKFDQGATSSLRL